MCVTYAFPFALVADQGSHLRVEVELALLGLLPLVAYDYLAHDGLEYTLAAATIAKHIAIHLCLRKCFLLLHFL